MNNEKGNKLPPIMIYASGTIALIYLLNPTAGFLELIPDNLPILGNIDEGAAAVLVWNAIQQFRNRRRIHR